MGPFPAWSRPLVLLTVLVLLSLAARALLLGKPCRSPCRSARDHVLVFDETYYVNAARAIAGIAPPANATYASAPLGDDPNAEHPQLVKLAIAGSIELFGDGPFAWRIGSLLFGTLAILGMFVLVRAAGGGEWLALGAAALMALDNLLLVHARIATLDIYVVTAMIWAVAAYLRRRVALAGGLIGVGACMKLVAPYALLVLVAFEGLEWLQTRRDGRRRLRALGVSAGIAAVVFVALLWVLDTVAPPYDSANAHPVRAGPFSHIGHMLSFASQQSSPSGPRGIASYPWQWLVDLKPITYLNINPARPAAGLYTIHPAAHFLGFISPAIMLLALPALLTAAVTAARSQRVPTVALAWFLGTFVPFVVLSLFWNRTSYLYYMVIVMPGIYIAVADMVARIGVRRKLVLAWMLAVVVAAVILYPFTPLP
jgi:dolichyl-phosphate-mannose-protein mannosyltransferase